MNSGDGNAEPPIRPLAGRDTLGRLGRLLRKELREILRDRRTIITLVLMPLLLYPLLGVAFRLFFISGQRAIPFYRIGVATTGEEQYLKAYLALARQARQRR